MAFKPLANRILTGREEEITTTASGIIIPDSAKEKPLQGKILAVGTDVTEEGISEGDMIVFNRYVGIKMILDGKELLILNNDDILGTIS